MKGLFGSCKRGSLADLLAVALGVGGVMTLLMLRTARARAGRAARRSPTQTAALLVVQHSQRLPHDDEQVLDAPTCTAMRRVRCSRSSTRAAGAALVRAPLEPLVESMAGMAGMASSFHRVERGGTAGACLSRARQRGRGCAGGRASPPAADLVGRAGARLLGGAAAAAALVALLGAAVLHWGLAPLRRLRMGWPPASPRSWGPSSSPTHRPRSRLWSPA